MNDLCHIEPEIFFFFRRGIRNALETRRLKAISWDAWARERKIEMNCEVKLVPRLISLISPKNH